jgi:hypothetical protein
MTYTTAVVVGTAAEGCRHIVFSRRNGWEHGLPSRLFHSQQGLVGLIWKEGSQCLALTGPTQSWSSCGTARCAAPSTITSIKRVTYQRRLNSTSEPEGTATGSFPA